MFLRRSFWLEFNSWCGPKSSASSDMATTTMGVRTPLIVHWPAGLKTRAGTLTHEPGHVMDLMATCLDVAGAAYPREYDGRSITRLEGKSLAATFRGEERAGHGALFWGHFGARAVRKGDWKLVSKPDGPWEIYDLATDQSETNDRAAERPELVRDLSAEWQAWAERVHAFPRPEQREAPADPKDGG